MNSKDLTIGDIAKIIETFNSPNEQAECNSHPYKIGKNYLIRTVTFTQLGKLEWVGEKELVLSSAVWVADTGRFEDALKNGIPSLDSSEIEGFRGSVIVGRGAIVDCVIYAHDLPSEQK